MWRSLLVRLAVGSATLVGVAMLVFFGTEALPGDAAQAVLGQESTPELVERFRREFGLDRPLIERFGSWVAGFARGDLGTSLPSGDPVTDVIGGKITHTGLLALLTLAILVPTAVLLGVGAAVQRDSKLDHLVTSSTLGMVAAPEFVVGSLLVVCFAVWLGLVPPVSVVDPTRSLLTQLDILILPIATLLTHVLAQTTRMIRACVIAELGKEYVQLAILKGLPSWRVLFLHVLPNAMAPTLQILAMNVAWLLGGVVVVEAVFQFPGLGLTMSKAVATRDIATVQAGALLITATYIVVNILVDVLVVVLNPRLRAAARI
jgi:peptide/nickel transport system permease protein